MFWLWINTDGRDANPALADILPGLPDPEKQRLWTGKTGVDTQTEGFEIYQVMRDLHAEHQGDLRKRGPVLDFGCGWGRVIRYFLKDLDPGQARSDTDHDEANVAFCVASNPWCTFGRNEATPPLPLADDSVGYLYAYSVFSHFSEPMHRLWLDEFERVLRPGGALALTVRPRGFIEHCGRLRSGEAKGVSPINKRMFLDYRPRVSPRTTTAGYAFSPYNVDDNDAWWGEACISREYVDREWGKRFEVLAFETAGSSRVSRAPHRSRNPLKQHVVLLRA